MIMAIHAVAKSDEVFENAQSSGESGGELLPVSFTNNRSVSQRLPTPRPTSVRTGQSL